MFKNIYDVYQKVDHTFTFKHNDTQLKFREDIVNFINHLPKYIVPDNYLMLEPWKDIVQNLYNITLRYDCSYLPTMESHYVEPDQEVIVDDNIIEEKIIGLDQDMIDYMKEESIYPVITPQYIDAPLERSVITLRGDYVMMRNTMLKYMSTLDPNMKQLVHGHSEFLVFTISPLFRTVFTGSFYTDNIYQPYNKIDTITSKRLPDFNTYLDIIGKEIFLHPVLKDYNFVFEGNMFQPYLERMRDKALEYDKSEYFDLYVLGEDVYDYLNTSVQKCYFDVYGWNKKPIPRNVNCYLFDNLKGSIEVDIDTYALIVDRDPVKTLVKFITGDYKEIKHFMNRPLVNNDGTPWKI